MASDDTNNSDEEKYLNSQIPEVLEVFGDLVERYHGIIVLVFSTLICAVLSCMFVLRQRIVRQDNQHKNCKNKFEKKFGGSGQDIGMVVESQPVSQSVVFSEYVPDSVLDTMAKQKAELIRAEKNIARSLTQEQKTTEVEAQRQQLEAIYKLMAENREKFGNPSFDQVQSQAAMYGR